MLPDNKCNYKKITLIIIVIFFCNTSVYCQNQDIYCADIDSLFLVHFLSLDKNINCDSLEVFVPQDDSRFVYVISYLSGISFKLHSYSGHPMLNREKFLNYKEWYLHYKQKIKCESYIRALDLLDKIREINLNVIDEQLAG